MTLATFVTILGAIVAFVEIGLFARWRDEGRISERAFTLVVISSAMLPVALFVIFTWIVPELGARELF